MSNRYVNKILLLMLLMLCSSAPSVAQWQLAAGAGSLTYYGDLSDRFVNMNLQEPGFHFFAERLLRKSVYLRLESINGHLLGSDRAQGGWLNRDLNGNSNFGRSLNFRSRVHDVNLSFVFYLMSRVERERMPFLTPYIRLGVGVGYFDVFGDLLSDSGERYYYWSDLTVRDRAEDAPDAGEANTISRNKYYETNLRELAIEQNYNRFKWQIPAAIGLRMRLANQLSLMLEAQYTYAFTDYLDNVGDLPMRPDITDPFIQYAADPAGGIGNGPRNRSRRSSLNDAYLYINAGLAFHLGSTAPPKFKAPIFYPAGSASSALEIPVLASDTQLFPDFPAVVESTAQAMDTNHAAVDIRYPQWKELRAIALSYEEVLDSLYYADLHQQQDNVLKEDLIRYHQLLFGDMAISENLSIDSIAIYKVPGTEDRMVFQYFIALEDSIAHSDNRMSDLDTIRPAKAFAYRIDTMQIVGHPIQSDSIGMVNLQHEWQRKLVDSILFRSIPLSAEYRMPYVLDAPVDTAPFISQPNPAVGLRLEHVSTPPITVFSAPILPMVDTLKTIPLRTAEPAVTDTLLLKNIEELKQRIDALQMKWVVQEEPIQVIQNDTLLQRKLSDLDQRMQELSKALPAIPANQPQVNASKESPPPPRTEAFDSAQYKMQRLIDQISLQRSQVNAASPTSTYTPPQKSKEKLSRSEKRALRADRTPVFIAYVSPNTHQSKATTPISASPVSVDTSVAKVKSSDSTSISSDSIGVSKDPPDDISPSKQSLQESTEPVGDSLTSNAEKLKLKEENDLLKKELTEIKKGQDSLMILLNRVFDKISTPAPVTVTAPSSIDPLDIVLRQGPSRVFFAIGKSLVVSQYRAGLDGIAEQLRKYPDLKVELKGFADPTGNAAANLKLSEQRARAVKQYLTQTHHISEERIKILPIGQEEGSQDLSYSRRVEVLLVRH